MPRELVSFVTSQRKTLYSHKKAQKEQTVFLTFMCFFVAFLHRLIRLRLLCGFFSFQLGELLFGLYVAGLIAERSQP